MPSAYRRRGGDGCVVVMVVLIVALHVDHDHCDYNTAIPPFSCADGTHTHTIRQTDRQACTVWAMDRHTPLYTRMHSVELGQWDGAYTAVLANPLPEARLDCLRCLVHELCERWQLATLMGLPLTGTSPAGDGAGSVSLVSEVGLFLVLLVHVGVCVCTWQRSCVHVSVAKLMPNMSAISFTPYLGKGCLEHHAPG